VAWLDCDLIFNEEELLRKIIVALQHYSVVQLFDDAVYLNESDREELRRPGVVASFQRDKERTMIGDNAATGFAWAARKEVLLNLGFLDCLIVGGADVYMACGFGGVPIPGAVSDRLSPALLKCVSRWTTAQASLQIVRSGLLKSRLSSVPRKAENRNYSSRYDILKRNDFDPISDLAVGANGLLQWKSLKVTCSMECRSTLILG